MGDPRAILAGIYGAIVVVLALLAWALPPSHAQDLKATLQSYGFVLLSVRDHGDGTYTVRVRRAQEGYVARDGLQ